MRPQILFFALMLLVRVGMRAQDVYEPYTDTIALSDDELSAYRLAAANHAVAGTWHYSGPSVQAQGTSLVGKLGKPLAKSKLKSKLKKAFDKLKIKKRWNSFELTPDGQWRMTLIGANVGGNYTYDPGSERLTLKWHGISLRSQVMRDGKRLHLLFDTDQLLTILRWVSGFSGNDTLKAIAFLSSNYTDVKVGFELKQ